MPIFFGSPYSFKNLGFELLQSRAFIIIRCSAWQLPRAALHLIPQTSPGTLQPGVQKCYVRSPCLFPSHSYLLWRSPRRRRRHLQKPTSPPTQVSHGPQSEILIAMACPISQLPKKIPPTSPFSKI